MSTKQTERSRGKLQPLFLAHSSLTIARLQTRTKYVQHEEDQLESRRKHCKFNSTSWLCLSLTTVDISVVKAFESALNLLKATGVHG
jgi:hypothetical protein